MIKVSVIVPCYNCRDYIDNCIRSLKFQIFRDFEVIFIDDCSSDNTFNYLEESLLKASFSYQIIRNNVNIGPGASRNKGIKLAKGQFVAFLDSDDWYDENFLEIMYKESFTNNLDVVMCNYYRVYSGGKKKAMYPTTSFEDSMTKKEFLAYSFDSLCCMLIKRDLFSGIEIPELFNAEDVAVIPLILSNATNIGFIRDNIYNYFHRENSLSNKVITSPKKVESIRFAYNHIYNRIADEFKDEVEFLGIKILLYGAVLNALYCNLGKEVVYSIIDDFTNVYSQCTHNQYIKSLPRSKRVFLYFVFTRRYWALIVLSFFHKLLFKLKIA